MNMMKPWSPPIESLFKMFNKTLNEGFFLMVIVDAVNHKVRWRMYCNKSLHSHAHPL